VAGVPSQSIATWNGAAWKVDTNASGGGGGVVFAGLTTGVGSVSVGELYGAAFTSLFPSVHPDTGGALLRITFAMPRPNLNYTTPFKDTLITKTTTYVEGSNLLIGTFVQF
jgi:hypothetical protein